MNNNGIMYSYIEETSKYMNILFNSDQLIKLSDEINLKKIKKLILVGSGSSYNAAYINSYRFNEFSNIQTYVYFPSEIDYFKDNYFDLDNTLVIGISQTGTSQSTIQALSKLMNLGYSIITITNNIQSPLSTLGNYHLNLYCGEEESNAKTKGYSNTVLLLAMLALTIGKLNGTLNDNLFKEIKSELAQEILDIPYTIQETKNWFEQNKQMKQLKNFIIVGQKENYGSAIEAVLKITETTGIIGTYCDTLEFSHGVHRAVNKDTDLYFITTDLDNETYILDSIKYFINIARKVIVINASNHFNRNEHYINLNSYKHTESVANIAVVFQVFSALLPELNDLDPNRDLNDTYTKIVKTR